MTAAITHFKHLSRVLRFVSAGLELLASPKTRRSCFYRWLCFADAGDRGGNDDAADIRGLQFSFHRYLDLLTNPLRSVSKCAGVR